MERLPLVELGLNMLKKQAMIGIPGTAELLEYILQLEKDHLVLKDNYCKQFELLAAYTDGDVGRIVFYEVE